MMKKGYIQNRRIPKEVHVRVRIAKITGDTLDSILWYLQRGGPQWVLVSHFNPDIDQIV